MKANLQSNLGCMMKDILSLYQKKHLYNKIQKDCLAAVNKPSFPENYSKRTKIEIQYLVLKIL